MNLRFPRNFWLWICVVMGLMTADLPAQKDPGREAVGSLEVTVYYATNGDPGAAGTRAQEISEKTADRLRSESRLDFTHYRVLGAETQPILRTYENWAQPLKPSDEILVRFETRTQPKDDEYILDLELWVSRKKILKTDAKLRPGQPLYVLGPEWRGGCLIIAVALAPQ
ncbi:hypothetical protein ACFSSA_00810 [Luteolibacter algae]|uniref:Uncharacterized protein n=1 Tax=Luteolibacter algae TaxID=454151 RepID=A0ABW5D2C3_9BACT